MKIKIYTTGFAGKYVGDLPALLERLDAVLADVRFTPVSTEFEWRREYLKLLLKNKYRHVAAFANRTENTDKITISNFNLGLKIIESWNENVVLMCACENLSECHRSALMNELRKKDFDVEEIKNWQFTSFF